MCGLCGLLGGPADWSEATAADPELPPRQMRLRRVALLNRVLAAQGLRVDDWQGAAYLVAGRTGRTEVADGLPQLWQAARAMLGRPLDPLDPDWLARLG